MHDKEYYERLVYEKAKKYAAKDDNMHCDRGDRGDDAKYREGWWLWSEHGAPGAGKNKAPSYYCIEEVHTEKKGPSQKNQKDQNRRINYYQ
jgi:hypothetical protein